MKGSRRIPELLLRLKNRKTGVPTEGEVNFALPNLVNQFARAQQRYADASDVDLVLVSGCANDVDVKNVLNAANTIEDIRQLAEAKCARRSLA